MSNEAHPGSEAWIEALDYPPEARAMDTIERYATLPSAMAIAENVVMD